MEHQGQGRRHRSAGAYAAQPPSSGSGTPARLQDFSTVKSRTHRSRQVRRLGNDVAEALSLPAGARRDLIDQVNRQAVEEVRRSQKHEIGL